MDHNLSLNEVDERLKKGTGAPAPEKQPGTVPGPEKQPGKAPAPEKKHGTAPNPEKQSEVARAPEKQPESAPTSEKQPGTAPAPKKQPDKASVSENKPDTTLESSPYSGSSNSKEYKSSRDSTSFNEVVASNKYSSPTADPYIEPVTSEAPAYTVYGGPGSSTSTNSPAAPLDRETTPGVRFVFIV